MTILVEPLGGERYTVTVQEDGGSSAHEVTVTAAHVERYAPGTPPETLLDASFRFLLEREPQASILARFDLPVIEHYFPDYPVADSELPLSPAPVRRRSTAAAIAAVTSSTRRAPSMRRNVWRSW